MAASLVQYIMKHVSPEAYYKQIFPNVVWRSPSNPETKVFSPFTEEKEPSLSINRDSGAWYSFCASDQKGGNSIVSFHAAYYDCTLRAAAKELYHKFIHPVIEEKLVRKWVRNMLKTPSVVSYLKKRRVSSRVARIRQLGWDGDRITIPIRNIFGLCVNAKLCSPIDKSGIPKMLNYTEEEESRSYGSPATLFPLDILTSLTKERLFICEGEWDTLALLSLGLPAITSTAGATTWPQQHNNHFEGQDVIVAYDNDEAGIAGARKVISQLVSIVKSLRRIKIPKKHGKDVSDLLETKTDMRNSQAWLSLASRAKPLVTSDKPSASTSTSIDYQGEERPAAVSVTLDEASQSKWFGKRIEVEALVTGKDTAPYILPRKYRVSCQLACEGCPIASTGAGFCDCEVDPTNPDMLSLVDSSEGRNRGKLLAIARIKSNQNCKAKITILETFNLEYLFLIPTLSLRSKEYVIRSGYYIGHGIRANKGYVFRGILIPHPRDQKTTFLFDSAQPVQDEIENFELTKKDQRELEIFRPKRLKILAHLNALADWQSRNVTKIVDRPDLHIAVDLAFHSVQSFVFNNELVSRGMLDILVLGDTRCGKGYVTEGLKRHYNAGDIASGDCCTFAGLIGGLQQLKSNWRITWGLIPLNNKRLVIIDETSSLSERDIGKLSRVRSEGIAEIVKIIRESTQANTRLIWLSNPRSGRALSSYNTGVEAVKELIGAVEDVSRFDFVLTLASYEVSSEAINITDTGESKDDSNKYPSKQCQKLVLWAWSRTVNQIVFTKKATKRIIELAIDFGHRYSPAIPIVQAENMRLKLAKISAAVAARVFSTDESHEKLIIKREHVDCTAQLLRLFYDKPSMSYNLFSKTAAVASKIEDSDQIEETLRDMSTNMGSTVTGLLETHQITSDNLADFVGDRITAKTIIGDLVQMRCLSRVSDTNWYIKNPLFTQLLRKLKKGNK